ncbi:MBL fold metallo-hydrolase [Rhizobium sp. K1/93]|uniref:MBL fold metallo-hydrolase n=1 Tax=Rhizobium sp. K1/93 TaxID=2819997 RepID=UPI0035A92E03
MLVDAGIPGSEGKIGQVLGRHGLSFRDIKLIVVTHAHTDHAGSAARLRALSGAPILAHADDVDFYTRRRPMTYCPTGLVGKLFFRTPAPHQPYEGFEPDMLMTNGETVNLLNFGVDGLVRHTAGHTAGSISVELGSQDVLVGDLLAWNSHRRRGVHGPCDTSAFRRRSTRSGPRIKPYGRGREEALLYGPWRPAWTRGSFAPYKTTVAYCISMRPAWQLQSYPPRRAIVMRLLQGSVSSAAQSGCKSARGPDADTHDKRLLFLTLIGSFLGSDSHRRIDNLKG